jgi:hypothetical protein
MEVPAPLKKPFLPWTTWIQKKQLFIIASNPVSCVKY